MVKFLTLLITAAGLLALSQPADAQYKKGKEPVDTVKTEAQLIMEEAAVAEKPVVITLEQALEIALSENISVKVADMEIQRTEYAKKGSYAALWPTIDASGAYQRTIKKQVMYMDFDMGSLGGVPGGDPSQIDPEAGAGTGSGAGSDAGASADASSEGGGLEVGRWNTWTGGITASMPLVSAQLWKSLKISGMDVELAVEKARASRLDMVTQVKNAYYAVLFSKEALKVYSSVYDNAVKNLEETEKKFKAQKVSEMELIRSKTTVANAIPNVYNAESSVILALWQLKAVLGVDLDMNLDVAGELSDFAEQMFYDIHKHDSVNLDMNTTMKQLAIQTEQLAEMVKMQKFANIPSLAVAFNFSMNAMTNDFKFSNYRWTPYSYVGLSLNIPIFAGGKRYQAIRQSKNQYEQVKLQTVNTERQLKIAIRQSLNTMEMNMKSYYAAQDAVATAQKGYDITEKSYEVGRGTLIELNDAQLALTQAKLAESQAIYNFVVAKSQLEQTLGQDFIE